MFKVNPHFGSYITGVYNADTYMHIYYMHTYIHIMVYVYTFNFECDKSLRLRNKLVHPVLVVYLC